MQTLPWLVVLLTVAASLLNSPGRTLRQETRNDYACLPPSVTPADYLCVAEHGTSDYLCVLEGQPEPTYVRPVPNPQRHPECSCESCKCLDCTGSCRRVERSVLVSRVHEDVGGLLDLVTAPEEPAPDPEPATPVADRVPPVPDHIVPSKPGHKPWWVLRNNVWELEYRPLATATTVRYQPITLPQPAVRGGCPDGNCRARR